MSVALDTLQAIEEGTVRVTSILRQGEIGGQLTNAEKLFTRDVMLALHHRNGTHDGEARPLSAFHPRKGREEDLLFLGQVLDHLFVELCVEVRHFDKLGMNGAAAAFSFQWQGTKFLQVLPVGAPGSVKVQFPKANWKG